MSNFGDFMRGMNEQVRKFGHKRDLFMNDPRIMEHLDLSMLGEHWSSRFKFKNNIKIRNADGVSIAYPMDCNSLELALWDHVKDKLIEFSPRNDVYRFGDDLESLIQKIVQLCTDGKDDDDQGDDDQDDDDQDEDDQDDDDQDEDDQDDDDQDDDDQDDDDQDDVVADVVADVKVADGDQDDDQSAVVADLDRFDDFERFCEHIVACAKVGELLKVGTPFNKIPIELLDQADKKYLSK